MKVLRPLVVILLLTAGSGCEQRLGVEEHRAHAVVKKYNLALPGVFTGRRPELLADVATEAEIDRVAMIVAGLAQDQKLLEARQELAEVEAVALTDPDHAEIVAEERWWYRHIHEQTRVDLQDPRRIHYRLRYHVLRQEGNWRLDRVEVIEERILAGT